MRCGGGAHRARHLIHPEHRVVDRLERRDGGPGDGADVAQLVNPLRECLRRAGDALAHREYNRIHLVSRLATFFGQLAHLVGDDGKATSVLPSARRFDRRVECEQVGLIRYGLDRAREANHFGERELQSVDLALRSVDDEFRPVEHFERLQNPGARAQRRRPNRLAELARACGHVVQRVRRIAHIAKHRLRGDDVPPLCLGVASDTRHRAADLARRRRRLIRGGVQRLGCACDLRRFPLDVVDDAPQPVRHARERRRQHKILFVQTGERYGDTQIALAERRRGVR